MPSADGKGLAWRTAGNQFHFVRECRKIKMADIDFVKRPGRMSVLPPRKIETHRRASIRVAFNDHRMIESRFLNSQAKPAPSSK
jgi:hypothetical protein